jgi:hypothetical protein
LNPGWEILQRVTPEFDGDPLSQKIRFPKVTTPVATWKIENRASALAGTRINRYLGMIDSGAAGWTLAHACSVRTKIFTHRKITISSAGAASNRDQDVKMLWQMDAYWS